MSKIVLVSCVKTKANHPKPAKELYISDLFRKSSAYARMIGDEWYILSAKYGLLAPEVVIPPYEKTLRNMGVADRKAWAKRVPNIRIISSSFCYSCCLKRLGVKH